MTEDVERVARAIYPLLFMEKNGRMPCNWDEADPLVHEASRGVAKVAMAALREPSTAVVMAMDWHTEGDVYNEARWQAGIDAALGEQKAETS